MFKCGRPSLISLHKHIKTPCCVRRPRGIFDALANWPTSISYCIVGNSCLSYSRDWKSNCKHYSDVIMSAMASQITGITIVYSRVGSGADQRKHQSSASLAFVRGIHRWQVNSPHKGPVMQKKFPIDDVIMGCPLITAKRHADLGWCIYGWQIVECSAKNYKELLKLNTIYSPLCSISKSTSPEDKDI